MHRKPILDAQLVRVALGQAPADLAIFGGRVVNVFTGEIALADIAIAAGRIAAVGKIDHCMGSQTQRLDASGTWLAPGLIDPHIHPEVSKLSMTRFAQAVLPRGTTTIMCSLDQVGVIAGLEAIRFCLDEAARTPLKVFYCGPSRLPYTTPASTVGATFGAAEHQAVRQWDETVGMWEYMIDSIILQEPEVFEAAGALLDQGRMLQGHLPFTSGPLLAGAIAAGAASDHESWFAHEVAEKLRAGLYVLLRKASCVDNIAEGIKAVTEMGLPTRRLSLCADDIDCTDITRHGHIDHEVRYAIQLGIEPVQAIQMATLNAAEAFRLDHLVGAITPGRCADILILDDLNHFKISQVIADGEIVAKDGRSLLNLDPPAYPPGFFNTMRTNRSPAVTERQIYLEAPYQAETIRVLVMHLEASQLRTRREATLPVLNGLILLDTSQGVNYISVTDRHSGACKTASAFISGFNLQHGAFATSLSPDDDNVICIGARVSDMAAAINYLFATGGGQVVMKDGQVQADLLLPILGIMTDETVEQVAEKEALLEQALALQGVNIPKPFFSILFLSITAIPEFAITDLGLVEAAQRAVVSPLLPLS